jgi:hypothetical protein
MNLPVACGANPADKPWVLRPTLWESRSMVRFQVWTSIQSASAWKFRFPKRINADDPKILPNLKYADYRTDATA